MCSWWRIHLHWGDLGSIPRLGRSPREGNGNPLQYSCLGNPMDRGASQATVHGVARVGQNLAPNHHPSIYVYIYLTCIYFAIYTCVYTHTHTHWRKPFSSSKEYNRSSDSESECRSVVSDSATHRLYSSWNSPGQNTRGGSLSLLQGIFTTQGSNPGLYHCRQILYQLSHQGSPRIMKWVAYPFSSGSSQPRNRTRVYCIAGWFFTSWATRQAP